MWGFLHDWSFAVAAHHPEAAPVPSSAVRLMTALSGVLPCTYCRHSYDIFLGSLGPLELLYSAVYVMCVLVLITFVKINFSSFAPLVLFFY